MYGYLNRVNGCSNKLRFCTQMKIDVPPSKVVSDSCWISNSRMRRSAVDIQENKDQVGVSSERAIASRFQVHTIINRGSKQCT